MSTHPELEAAGARLRYRDEGQGRAVIFVHGWTLDLDVWEPQAPLAARLRVVRYDRRGFGLSDGRPSLTADVADLRMLIEHLGIASPLLVGMSQGARVVLDFAARHPGVARGLVLDGPPALAGAAETAEDLPLAELQMVARRAGLAAFLELWRAHPLTQLVTPDPRMHALLDQILARYPGRDLEPSVEAARESIDTRLLAQIRLPVLIVNGLRDTEHRRRAGQRLRESLESAERVLIPNAAHMPNLDVPHAYNQLLCEFAHRYVTAAA
jgi:pimeloyl-ACP methyl ester carboxylesterase